MTDHPRSRGVYPRDPVAGGAGSGSSPLARGLRRPVAVRAIRSLDHPRSRGVYAFDTIAEKVGLGSSPLARGLRAAEAVGLGGEGIIPARAGFTHDRSPAPQSPEDHPRSRGVYKAVADITDTIDGSSPLARGLPRLHPRDGARGEDHPRSRGVYASALAAIFPTCGSSPLARGLHRPHAHGPLRGRIIPARAGFTLGQAAAHVAQRDHPRSRGVYGSAPGHLARVPGIIPARAGFT